jgi:D-aspartate ligase
VAVDNKPAEPARTATMARAPVDATTAVVVLCPGYHGHGVARTLGRMGVRVYGVHQDGASPAARSRYWTRNFVWDLAHAPQHVTVDWLLQLTKGIGGRPILIPTDDDSCLLVAEHAEMLRAGFRFPDQPDGLACELSSKQTMHSLCKRHGVPVAETSFPRSRVEAQAFAATARFPIMVKGIDTLALQRRTGRKMALAHDAAELLRLYDALEDPRVNAGAGAGDGTGAKVAPSVMLQEYLPGGSRTLWMFDGYFDADARCLFGLTGQKIREYPAYTGRTSLGVCLPNPTVAQQTIAFMQALGYRGAIDLDYKYDARTGEYKLIDVNPRLGATFRLFVDTARMDVVRALYLDLTGQPVVVGEPQTGRKWVMENFEALCVPTYLRQERLGLFGWLRSYRGLAEACWFAPDDPAPFLALAPQSARWALAKWLDRSMRSTA